MSLFKVKYPGVGAKGDPIDIIQQQIRYKLHKKTSYEETLIKRKSEALRDPSAFMDKKAKLLAQAKVNADASFDNVMITFETVVQSGTGNATSSTYLYADIPYEFALKQAKIQWQQTYNFWKGIADVLYPESGMKSAEKVLKKVAASKDVDQVL